jgi:hypothetical protein
MKPTPPDICANSTTRLADRAAGETAADQDQIQRATVRPAAGGTEGRPVAPRVYWVTDSSVLAATANRVTMLMFLQGELGTAPDQRYLTASVRVSFVEAGASGWRVDELAVVNEPRTVEAKP